MKSSSKATSHTKLHNDKPICEPRDDRFGIDPFAKALAASIRKLESPDGTVIALNGPWGSGKSSAINLIQHHLKGAIEAGDIKIVSFACWWFRGEEELALAFFRELYAGLGVTLGTKFKKLFPKLGARLLRAGAVVGPAIDLAGGGGAGTVAAGTMNWISDLISQDVTVEKLQSEVNATLDQQTKRFLIVIDDIDRLSPDEALLIFRLVKSVGRLPNVIYLLAFDRTLAEAIVAERYPSEGPHYLEKIIQAGFDLPEPRPEDLRQELLAQIDQICRTPSGDEILQFMNTFYDLVAPAIKTPRDLKRLANALAITWPPVASDVDLADFVGIETLRVLFPKVYRTLRVNKSILCGTDRMFKQRSRDEQRRECDRIFLAAVDPQNQEELRRGLMRLFPPLQSVWSNVVYGDHSVTKWAVHCRICSSAHFESYFRFSIGNDVLAKMEIDGLIDRASDKKYIIGVLLDALTAKRSGGATKAALILDELNLHADSITDNDVEPLLTALFEIADELNVPSDKARAFSIGDNNLRIHWLMRRLILERFSLAQRSVMLVAACRTASLCWIVWLADSAFADYHPRSGKSPEPESNCLTTASDADKLRKVALRRLRDAAKSGALGKHPELIYLLYRWRDLAADNGGAVKRWSKSQLVQDKMIIRFVDALTTHGWSQSVDDRVALRTTNINVEGIEAVLDKKRFRARLEKLASSGTLSKSEAEMIVNYRDALRRHEANIKSKKASTLGQ